MDVDELELLQEEREEQPIRYLPKVLNGGISGIVGVSCVFPMDLVKTRLQNQKRTATYDGILDCFRKSWQAGAPGRLNQIKGMYQVSSSCNCCSFRLLTGRICQRVPDHSRESHQIGRQRLLPPRFDEGSGRETVDATWNARRSSCRILSSCYHNAHGTPENPDATVD